jgi:hypothetical protein
LIIDDIPAAVTEADKLKKKQLQKRFCAIVFGKTNFMELSSS